VENELAVEAIRKLDLGAFGQGEAVRRNTKLRNEHELLVVMK